MQAECSALSLCQNYGKRWSRDARNDVDLRSNDVVPAVQMKKSKSKDLDFLAPPAGRSNVSQASRIKFPLETCRTCTIEKRKKTRSTVCTPCLLWQGRTI